MARRSPPRKVTYFEPVPPRLARNTIIESQNAAGGQSDVQGGVLILFYQITNISGIAPVFRDDDLWARGHYIIVYRKK
jgi:hypothetical protein